VNSSKGIARHLRATQPSLVWFNNKTNSQDAKIERIESRLYDCFEDRIKENTRINLFGREAVETSNVYAVIPEEIKIKRA